MNYDYRDEILDFLNSRQCRGKALKHVGNGFTVTKFVVAVGGEYVGKPICYVDYKSPSGEYFTSLVVIDPMVLLSHGPEQGAEYVLSEIELSKMAIQDLAENEPDTERNVAG